MLSCRAFVDVMARDASRALIAQHDDVTDRREDMGLGGLESLHGLRAEIDREVAEQVVAGDEVVGIRQAGRSRSASARVALGADRDDDW